MGRRRSRNAKTATTTTTTTTTKTADPDPKLPAVYTDAAQLAEAFQCFNRDILDSVSQFCHDMDEYEAWLKDDSEDAPEYMKKPTFSKNRKTSKIEVASNVCLDPALAKLRLPWWSIVVRTRTLASGNRMLWLELTFEPPGYYQPLPVIVAD